MQYKVGGLTENRQKEMSKLTQQRLKYPDFFFLGMGNAPQMLYPTPPRMQLNQGYYKKHAERDSL